MTTQAPYVGLRPYEEGERNLFFGRAGEQQILISKIHANKLNLLLAASGVGKSSLLNAGVIPKLRDSGVEVVYQREWSGDPTLGLKRAIANHFITNGQLGENYQPNLELALAAFLHHHTLLCSGLLLLVLDQFEEFFYCQRFSNYRDAFLQQLAAAIHDRNVPTGFLLSMREDFAMELDRIKPYLSGVFDHYYRIDKLGLEQAKQAIVRPLQEVGWEYQENLPQHLLEELAEREWLGHNDLTDNHPALATMAVEPPHLQIIGQALWQRRGGNKIITLASYQQAGKAKGILATYFQKKMSRLSAENQHLASSAFNYLVNPHGGKIAYPLTGLAKLLRQGRGNYREALYQTWYLLTHQHNSNTIRDTLRQIWQQTKKTTRSRPWVDSKTFNTIGYQRLKKALDCLYKDAILRRSSRQGVLRYELYHDLFAHPISQWNHSYKMRALRHRLMIHAGITITIALFLSTSYLYWDHASHSYLRLSELRSISSQIEIYGGQARAWDPFHQNHFLYETPYTRSQLEPDKRATHAAIITLANLRAELIDRLPLDQRFPEYGRSGLLDSGFALAKRILHSGEDDQQLINKLAAQLPSTRLELSVTLLEKELSDIDRNKQNSLALLRLPSAKSMASIWQAYGN